MVAVVKRRHEKKVDPWPLHNKSSAVPKKGTRDASGLSGQPIMGVQQVSNQRPLLAYARGGASLDTAASISGNHGRKPWASQNPTIRRRASTRRTGAARSLTLHLPAAVDMGDEGGPHCAGRQYCPSAGTRPSASRCPLREHAATGACFGRSLVSGGQARLTSGY